LLLILVDAELAQTQVESVNVSVETTNNSPAVRYVEVVYLPDDKFMTM